MIDRSFHNFFSFEFLSCIISGIDDYFFIDPLVPYRVTVVAVNLAGPGEQETMNFFTREGGVFLIIQVNVSNYICCVYGRLLAIY